MRRAARTARRGQAYDRRAAAQRWFVTKPLLVSGVTKSGAKRAPKRPRDLGAWGARALLAALLCGLLGPAAGQAYSPPPIKHVFVLVDENESASMVFHTGSAAPYLSQTLVAEGAYLPNYYAIGHNGTDNYIAMVSGQAPNPLTSADCLGFVDFPAGDSLK